MYCEHNIVNNALKASNKFIKIITILQFHSYATCGILSQKVYF